MEMEQSMVQSIQLASFYLQKSSHEPHVYTCSVLLYSKISTDFHEFVYLLVAGCLLQPSDQEPWCSDLEWGEGIVDSGGGAGGGGRGFGGTVRGGGGGGRRGE